MKFDLNAEIRSCDKNSELNDLRRQGFIPAVVYGTGLEPISISIAKAKFQECYKQSFKEVTFYEIMIGNKQYHTILRDCQIHPVSREFLHLDFLVVARKSQIEIDMPVNLIGEPAGVKAGGLMDVIQRTVKVICQADKLPEDIKVDISGLQVGESIHVRDLPEGHWHYKDLGDNTIVVIHPKKGDSIAATQEISAEPADSTEE